MLWSQSLRKALDRMWFSHEFSGVIFFFLQLVSEGCCDIKALNTIEAKQKKCERFEKDSNIKTYIPAYLIPISEKRTIHSIVMPHHVKSKWI